MSPARGTLEFMTSHHVYKPIERPDVQVLVDGDWLPGEARMRTTHPDGQVVYQVAWRPPGDTSRRLDTFPLERVRLDQNLDR